MKTDSSNAMRATLFSVALIMGAAASVPRAASADVPHDACGADAGPNATSEAMGRFVFAEPIAAPAQGAHFEPSCSAAVTRDSAGWIGWTMALVAIGSVSRRRRPSATRDASG